LQLKDLFFTQGHAKAKPQIHLLKHKSREGDEAERRMMPPLTVHELQARQSLMILLHGSRQGGFPHH